ncbi:DNA-binding protein [Bacteroides helcogenes]|uniref:HU domain-containing protein n=1 Tax=Bacteroides helcogenes (strain ATCC 35417 / DSM 20613 / JCM 6297 / CCUG 15421 / P 36-108) TaxID=693979 RepID=E6SVK7_BACT6|nr:DNA-binding protein [Bacteroides helcogenes]ADV43468.1 hypothetical protein Bache_1463 [Bacteroides helcogenes P 36-108]MDY5239043.1 DNA-binding protein [Bacteroides helcogenes]
MAYYDLKKKPPLTTKEGEEDVLYPEIVYIGTITAKELLEYTSKCSGFKVGAMDGMLMSIFDGMVHWLNQGFRVELGEFGYFSGKIKANRLVKKKTDIRSGSIHFGDVNFRPSAKLKKALDGELTRTPDHTFRHSSNHSMDELEQWLMAYLDKNSFIKRTTYTEQTGRLKWKATQDLKFFMEKGLIVSKGRGNQKYYVRAEKEQ